MKENQKKQKAFFLEFIITKLETVLENGMNEGIQRNKIEEKNFYKNKNNEVYIRYNIKDFDTFRFEEKCCD